MFTFSYFNPLNHTSLKFKKTIQSIHFCLLIYVLPLLAIGQLFEESISPLDIPIAVSGTFSEYRKTHFHSGLDMRTNGEKGLNIYSISDGWVSRIRASTSGYGKVLYITHHDGHTSVYAHLDKFASEIQDYVKKRQYAQEKFEIHLFPEKNILRVKAGQIIGYSGNTGSSLGAHLHFEIRNPNNGLINPLKLPFYVPDTIAPIITRVFAYSHRDDDLKRNELNFLKKDPGNGIYIMDTLVGMGPVSFGIQMHDRSNLSANVNGIYSAEVKADHQLIMNYKFDNIQFTDRNYINLMIDYPQYRLNNIPIQRLYKDPFNQVSFLDTHQTGLIKLEQGDSISVELIINDFHQNTSIIKANLIGGTPKEAFEKVYPINSEGILINKSKSHQLQYGRIEVNFPKNAFFQDVRLNIKQSNDTISLGQDTFPVRNPFTISFTLDESQQESTDDFYIGKLDNKGNTSFVSSKIDGNIIRANVSSLGTYSLLSDQIPPEIMPLNIYDGADMSQEDSIKIQVTDNLGKLQSYYPAIDGQWVLFEYEPKEDMLFFDFSDIELSKGIHQLDLSATDRVGNKSQIKISFKR